MRIFRLWRIVAGYSLGIVAVIWLFIPSVSLSWHDWASAVMPVTFDTYWFFTKYVALFLTIPYLNKLLKALSGKEMISLLISGFVLLSLSSVLTGKDLFGTGWGYSYVWFLYLYLVGASLSMYEVKNKISGWCKISALLAGCVLAAAADPFSAWLVEAIGGGGRFGELAWSYTSPFMLLEAVMTLLIFASLDVKSAFAQGLIKWVAPGTFVVYIIHMNRSFRQAIDWNHIFLCLAGHGECIAALGTLIVSLCLFAVIVMFDCARRSFVRLILGVCKF